jgi:hypothetical protein
MAKKSKAVLLDDDEEVVTSASVVDDDDDDISNATDVPLFSGAGFANNRAIAKLKLVKLDNPGAGYKGEIPTASTLETIGQLFGDGVYNIEAVNARGFRLRVLENQRIALGVGPMDGSRPAPPPPSTSKEDLDRVERLARQSASESVQQAAMHTRLVADTTAAAAAREREFMQGVNGQTQQFFASILAAQSQGFQQLMAMMQAGHTHMMEAMAASAKGSGNGDSGERTLGLFMQGMQLGREMDSPDEKPFWQEILQGGAHLLTGARTAQLGAGEPGTATRKPTKARQKLARIVKAMRARGIDPDELADMLENGGPSPKERPDESTDESDESDSGPQGPIFTGEPDTDSDTD